MFKRHSSYQVCRNNFLKIYQMHTFHTEEEMNEKNLKNLVLKMKIFPKNSANKELAVPLSANGTLKMLMSHIPLF